MRARDRIRSVGQNASASMRADAIAAISAAMKHYREQIETALEKKEEINPQHIEGVRQCCLTASKYLGLTLSVEYEVPLIHDKPAQKLRIKDLAGRIKLNL